NEVTFSVGGPGRRRCCLLALVERQIGYVGEGLRILKTFSTVRGEPFCAVRWSGERGGGAGHEEVTYALHARLVASVRERGRHGRSGGGGGARWRGGLRGCRDVLELSGAVPAAVSLHAGEELDERSERARLLQGRVPPLLPVQPVRLAVGSHVLGP